MSKTPEKVVRIPSQRVGPIIHPGTVASRLSRVPVSSPRRTGFHILVSRTHLPHLEKEGVLGLKRVFGYDVADIWRQLALEIGADFERGRSRIFQRPKLTLKLGDRSIVLDIHTPGISGIRDEETWIRALLVDWDPFTFAIRSRTLWSAAKRRLSSASHTTGCPDLDDRFDTESSNPERLRDLFSRPHLCKLLTGHKNLIYLGVSDTLDERNDAAFPHDFVLLYREEAHVRDPERLKRLLLAFVEILTALEGSRALADADPEALASSWGLET